MPTSLKELLKRFSLWSLLVQRNLSHLSSSGGPQKVTPSNLQEMVSGYAGNETDHLARYYRIIVYSALRLDLLRGDCRLCYSFVYANCIVKQSFRNFLILFKPLAKSTVLFLSS